MRHKENEFQLTAPPDKHPDLAAHFSVLLDLSQTEQQLYLEHLSSDADSAALSRQLRLMLKADDGKDFDTLINNQVTKLTGDDALENLSGETIGAFTLKQVIGRGGMGIVYEAHRSDGVFEQRVAIKFVYPSVTALSGRETVFFEARCLGQLAHHHIVSILDAGQLPSGACYFVMEFIEGVSIDKYCKEKQLSAHRIVDLVITLCTAIEAAHHINIVHSDIKPNNVVVDHQGQVKVLDFGIAKILDESISDPRDGAKIKGSTKQFAAPEQLNHDAVSFVADVYALGALLEYLIQDTHSSLNNTQHRELLHIISLCKQDEPEQRYQSVAALRQELENWRDNRVLSFQARYSLPSFWKLMQRNIWQSVLAVMLIITLPSGGYYQYQLSVQQAQSAEVEKHLSSFIRYTDPAIAQQPMSTSVQMLTDTFEQVLSSTTLNIESQHRIIGDIFESLIGLGEYRKVRELSEREGFQTVMDIDPTQEFALTRHLIDNDVRDAKYTQAYERYDHVLERYPDIGTREKLLLGVSVSRALRVVLGDEGLTLWRGIHQAFNAKSHLFSKQEQLANRVSEIHYANHALHRRIEIEEDERAVTDPEIEEVYLSIDKILRTVPVTHPFYTRLKNIACRISGLIGKNSIDCIKSLTSDLNEIAKTYGSNHPLTILGSSFVGQLHYQNGRFSDALNMGRYAHEKASALGYFGDGAFWYYYAQSYYALGHSEIALSIQEETYKLAHQENIVNAKFYEYQFDLVWNSLEFKPDYSYDALSKLERWLEGLAAGELGHYSLDAEKLFVSVLRLSLAGQYDLSIDTFKQHQDIIDGSNLWAKEAVLEYLYRKKGDFTSSLNEVDKIVRLYTEVDFLFYDTGLQQDAYLWKAQALAELGRKTEAAELLQICFDFSYELRAEADNFWLQVVATMSNYYQLPLDTYELDVPLIDNSFLLTGGEQPIFGQGE
ncbi:serine/threonine-protein kinase [Planctobacterium marinum]|uniref:Protein kinase domain-containing protein n=1 Tax=Planctobacterium marinum TaxID=1631968 RepID=A0AA48HSQ1_9ALTE|nr:hypothetical protein MACH26_28100 [Planctobacterium marinum]